MARKLINFILVPMVYVASAGAESEDARFARAALNAKEATVRELQSFRERTSQKQHQLLKSDAQARATSLAQTVAAAHASITTSHARQFGSYVTLERAKAALAKIDSSPNLYDKLLGLKSARQLAAKALRDNGTAFTLAIQARVFADRAHSMATHIAAIEKTPEARAAVDAANERVHVAVKNQAAALASVDRATYMSKQVADRASLISADLAEMHLWKRYANDSRDANELVARHSRILEAAIETGDPSGYTSYLVHVEHLEPEDAVAITETLLESSLFQARESGSK